VDIGRSRQSATRSPRSSAPSPPAGASRSTCATSTERSSSAAHAAHADAGCLAVNVKADGLQAGLADALAPVARDDWFAFDMSVPDTLGYLHHGLPIFTRHSDVEPEPVLLDRAGGVWLDDFGGGWLDEAHVARHLAAGLKVAVVSPELHGRDHRAAWQDWRRWSVWASPDVLLCTDLPTDAEEVFA
jgi:hypothetical protein